MCGTQAGRRSLISPELDLHLHVVLLWKLLWNNLVILIQELSQINFYSPGNSRYWYIIGGALKRILPYSTNPLHGVKNPRHRNVPAGSQGVQWYKIQSAINKDKGFGVNSVGIPFLSDYNLSQDNDRTKFWFEPVQTVAPDHRKLKSPVAVDFSQKPQDHDASTKNTKEWRKQLVSVEAIPAAMVNLNRYSSKIDQIMDNPYYYLEYHTLWKKRNEFTLSAGTIKNTIQVTDAFSKTEYESVEKTIGHLFKTEVEAGIKGKTKTGLKAFGSIKLTYQFTTQTKTLKGSSNTADWSVVKTEERTLPALPADGSYNTECEWVPVHQYIMKDARGQVAETWNYEESSMRHFQKMKY